MDLLSHSSTERQSRQIFRIGMAFALIVISSVALGLAQSTAAEATTYTQLLTGTLKDQSGHPIICTNFCKITASISGESASTEIRNGTFSFYVPDGTLDIWLGDGEKFMRDDGGSKVNRVNSFSAGTWNPSEGSLDLKMPNIETAEYFHVTNAAGAVVSGVYTGYDPPPFTSTSFELRAAIGSHAAVMTTIQFYGMDQTDSNGDAIVYMYPTAETSRTSIGVDFSGTGLNVSLLNTPTQGVRAIAMVAPGGNYLTQDSNAPTLSSLSLSRESNSAPINLDTTFNASRTVYSATVLGTAESLNVLATSDSQSATVTVLNDDNLSTGEHIVTVLVKDSVSGATRSYVIVVTVAIPTPQETLTVTSVNGTIGSPLTLTTSGGTGIGLVTYAVTNGTAAGCAESGGVLTVASLGTCLVVATKASDSTYAEASSISTAMTFGDIVAPALYTGGFTFTVADGNATVTGLTSGGSGCEGKYLVVPADDGAGHPVTAIGFKAFQRYSTNCHLTGVSIPQTMTLIGSEAFAWNQTMTEINIPTSVTLMENYAFTGAAENVATKIYFEGDRPTIRSNVFASEQSGRIFYKVGQIGWPGTTIDSYAPEVSARISQATLTMSSTTSGTAGTPITLTSSGGSGWGGIVYELDGSDCVLSVNVLSRSSAGSCMVRVSKSPTAIYARANSSWANVTFAVLLPQETLTLTSNQTSPIGTPITLSTSGGSGTGLMSYQVYDGTATGCAENIGMLTSTTTGTCEVTATKAADSTYSERISIRKQFVFHLWDQQALVLTSTTGVVGTPLTLTYSGGSGNGAVSYQMYYYSGTASDCVVANGTVSASSAGTCLVQLTKSSSGNYEGSSVTETVTFTVAQTTTTTEPSSTTTTEPSTTTTQPSNTLTTTTQPSSTSTTTTQPSNTLTTTTQPSNTSTTSTTAPPPAESVVVGLPQAETPLVADNSLTPGAEVTVTFGGFVPGEFVQLIVASTPQVIGSGYADAQGVVTLSGNIPADLASGNHTLAVYAPVSGVGFNQPITVAGIVLPATGWSSRGTLHGWAMLMILLGVVWHFIGSRRNTVNS